MASDWYKRYPRDFLDKVAGLPLDCIAGYALLLDTINLLDRSLPDDDKYVAELLHIHPRRWRRIKDALIAKGPIEVADGRVRDPNDMTGMQARLELRTARTEAGHQGGLASGLYKKNNGLSEANGETSFNQTRGEEIKRDSNFITRDREGFYLIPYGTPEYNVWRMHLLRCNSADVYKFPNESGHVARVVKRWPPHC